MLEFKQEFIKLLQSKQQIADVILYNKLEIL
jgi:hypothetical protein